MKIKPHTIQLLGYGILYISLSVIFAVIIFVMLNIFINGHSALSWEFLTEAPRLGMTEGGIFPAIVGTFLLTIITALVSIPLGVSAAIFLNEYARNDRFTRVIRLAIRNLGGVPSIVYGLFGMVLFVQFCKFGDSLLSAGLTLGLLSLPTIITASEEALKSIPVTYREASLALGASKWQCVRTNVLPYAFPGILTGTILGLARAMGETAPILFTGVAFFYPYIPRSPFEQFMALPYHLYILATQHHSIEQVRPLAYGTAAVLLGMVIALNLTAIVLRYHYRKKYWQYV